MWDDTVDHSLDVDFSTSFGDAIFGLLFFFFILALALVFQKPQVKIFHKEIDRILKDFNASKKDIKLLQRKIELLEAELEKAKKKFLELQLENQKLKSDSSQKVAQIQLLQKENESLKNSLNQMLEKQGEPWDKSNWVEKKYYDQLQNEKEALENELDDIKEKYLDEIDNLEEKQKKETKAMYRNYLKVLDEYQTKLHKFKEYKSIAEKVLKKRGMENVLAEIEDLSKKQESKSKGEKEKEMVEKSDIPRFQLYIRQYDSDDFGVEVRVNGKTEATYDDIDEDDTLRLIEEVMNKFDEISKDKDDKERAKNQPVAYVMVKPSVPYGAFNSFVVKSRKIIGKMSIIDWESGGE